MTLVDLLFAAFTGHTDIDGALVAVITVEQLATAAFASRALGPLDAGVAVYTGGSIDQDVGRASSCARVTDALQAVSWVLIFTGHRSTTVRYAGSLVTEVSAQTEVHALTAQAVFIRDAGPGYRWNIGADGRV